MVMLARKNKSSAFGVEDRLLIVFALGQDSASITKSAYVLLPSIPDERMLPKIHSMKISKLDDLGKGAFSIVIQLSKKSLLAIRVSLAQETTSFGSFLQSLQNALANGSYCIHETDKEILEGNKLLDTRNPSKSHFFRCDQHHL